MPRWLLPETISDVLPREARRVEEVRRALLDLYAGYGYELVIPPLIEYIDSLLTSPAGGSRRWWRRTSGSRSGRASTPRDGWRT